MTRPDMDRIRQGLARLPPNQIVRDFEAVFLYAMWSSKFPDRTT